MALAVPATARAQACCAGGIVLTPGRLQIHESALVGLVARGTAITGSFDGRGSFVSPRGAVEGDFEQDLIATLRVLGDGQLTVLMPIVETYRRESGTSDGGGGFGDLQVSARWDPTYAGASRRIPGIAVLASVILPTGLPLEQATHPLSTDSTGTGAVQGALGLSLEQTFGKVLVNLTGSGTIHSARNAQGVHSLLGPSFYALGAVGYSFDAGPVAALTLSYTRSLDTRIDGAAVAASGLAQLRFGLSGGYSINDTWRVQASAFGDPPAPHFGQNQLTGVGGTAAVFRVW